MYEKEKREEGDNNERCEAAYQLALIIGNKINAFFISFGKRIHNLHNVADSLIGDVYLMFGCVKEKR